MRAVIAQPGGAIELDVIDVVEVDPASNKFRRLRAFFDLAGARKLESR